MNPLKAAAALAVCVLLLWLLLRLNRKLVDLAIAAGRAEERRCEEERRREAER